MWMSRLRNLNIFLWQSAPQSLSALFISNFVLNQLQCLFCCCHQKPANNDVLDKCGNALTLTEHLWIFISVTNKWISMLLVVLVVWCLSVSSINVLYIVFSGTVTESSETSSQCTSSDSVTGLSTLTIPRHTNIIMDSYNNNNNEPSSSFLCSSTPPSSMVSVSIFQKDEDLQPQGTKFITAVSVYLLSLEIMWYYALVVDT